MKKAFSNNPVYQTPKHARKDSQYADQWLTLIFGLVEAKSEVIEL